MSVEGGFFSKQSAEEYPILMPYKNKLPSGATIDSATVSAILKSDGSDATSTVLTETSATVSGTDVVFGVQAGADGSRYKITVTVLLDTTPGILIDEIDMFVKDT